MKSSTLAAILAPAVVLARGPWWDGAPNCAQDCFASYWSSSEKWPEPTNYCGVTQAASAADCINRSCSATPTAYTSYSSLASSLCSRWSSCSAAGSTAVQTITAPGVTVSWGPDNDKRAAAPTPPPAAAKMMQRRDRNGRDDDDDDWWGDDDNWGKWGGTEVWSGGVYTVTGCAWNGSPWAGGPYGWGIWGSPWGFWGDDVTWTTKTATITQVATITDNGNAIVTTSIGIATVAQAVNGGQTTQSIVNAAEESGAAASPSSTGNAAAGGRGEQAAYGVQVMGAVLGAVVGVVAYL